MKCALALALCLLCAAASSSASAQDVPDSGPLPPPDVSFDSSFPHVRGRPAMPADGALLIESSTSFYPAVTMFDPDGAIVIGTTRQVFSTDTTFIVAWAPEQELAEGTYIAMLTDTYDESLSKAVEIEVLPPFGDELPPFISEPSTSLVTMPSVSEFCTDPLGQTHEASRFVVREEIAVRMSAGLWSSASAIQLNQYFFRLVPTGPGFASADDVFRPFEQLGDAMFYESADEHCLELHVENLATEGRRVYEEPICVRGVDQPLGAFDVAVEDRSLAMRTCFVPPTEHEARWCELNEPACDTKPSDGCELYDFVCNDGPVPALWRLTDDSVASASSDGCSVAARTSRRGTLGALAVLLAGLALSTRRRKLS